MDIDWSKLLEQVLLVAIPILVPVLCALLMAQINLLWVKARSFKPRITDLLEEGAKFAIDAVEQLKKAGVIKKEDTDAAKAAGIEIMQRWLTARKITVDVKLISDAVKSGIWKYFNSGNKSDSIGYDLPNGD